MNLTTYQLQNTETGELIATIYEPPAHKYIGRRVAQRIVNRQFEGVEGFVFVLRQGRRVLLRMRHGTPTQEPCWPYWAGSDRPETTADIQRCLDTFSNRCRTYSGMGERYDLERRSKVLCLAELERRGVELDRDDFVTLHSYAEWQRRQKKKRGAA